MAPAATFEIAVGRFAIRISCSHARIWEGRVVEGSAMEPILTQRRASGTGIRDERKKETWPMQAPVQVPPPWVYRLYCFEQPSR